MVKVQTGEPVNAERMDRSGPFDAEYEPMDGESMDWWTSES
jgi:hypothetical protein